MKTFLFCLFTIYILQPLSATVELSFLPNRPVRQESTLSLKLEQYLPHIQINSVMEQTMEADLVIVDRSDLPVHTPPINILFTLKNLNATIKSQEGESSYAVDHPGTSLFLAEINDMVNKPIKLYFDEKFQLKADTPDIVQLAKELPILSEIHPQSFIQEFFEHLFSLAGKELTVGKEMQIEQQQSGMGLKPNFLTYTISSIDEQAIHANLSGKLQEFVKEIPFELSLSEPPDSSIQLTLNGDIEGDISWDRKNALLYTLDASTHYHGQFTIASWQWNMDLTLSHQVHSFPQGEKH